MGVQTEWMGAHYAPYMCAYNVALHTQRLLPTVPEFQPLREVPTSLNLHSTNPDSSTYPANLHTGI